MKLLFTMVLLFISCNIVASECDERCLKDFYKCLNTNCQETTKILTDSYNKMVELLESSINSKMSQTDVQKQLDQTRQKADEVKGLFRLTLGCNEKLNQCKSQCPR